MLMRRQNHSSYCTSCWSTLKSLTTYLLLDSDSSQVIRVLVKDCILLCSLLLYEALGIWREIMILVKRKQLSKNYFHRSANRRAGKEKKKWLFYSNRIQVALLVYPFKIHLWILNLNSRLEGNFPTSLTVSFTFKFTLSFDAYIHTLET